MILPILMAGYELFSFGYDIYVKIKQNTNEITVKEGADPVAVNNAFKTTICGLIGAYSSIMNNPNAVVKSIMDTYYGGVPVYQKYDLKDVQEVTPDSIDYKTEYLPKQDQLYIGWINSIKQSGFTKEVLDQIMTDLKGIQTEESSGTIEKSEIFDAVGDLLLKKLGVPSLTGRIKFNAMTVIKKILETKPVLNSYANFISAILFQNYNIK